MILFLAHFDVHTGYSLVWSKSSIPLDGLDYKVLPSGIHNTAAATVFVSHLHGEKLYYGLGRFRQYQTRDSEAGDRAGVKMYSLGMLCEPIHADWKPNEYLNTGWEYIDFLDSHLVEFLETENYSDFSVLERAYDTIAPSKSLQNHPIAKLADFVETLGPLVYVAHKQALLRKRILIMNKDTEYFAVNAFTYVLSLLASIPKSDLDTEQSVPVYTVGLPDLGTALLETPGYIGVTNDDILLEHKCYDIAIILHEGVKIQDSHGNQIKATQADYSNFKVLYQELFGSRPGNLNNSSQSPQITNQDSNDSSTFLQVPSLRLTLTNHSNISTDDLSVHTTYSVSTAVRGHAEVQNEPQWWYEQTESRSWSGSFWNAFSWFASAGAAAKVSPTIFQVGSVDLMQLVNVVGSFHRRINRFVVLVEEVMEEQKGRGFLELTYSDFVDMRLDPYSEQDREFVREFVRRYWGVEVEMGVGSLCC